MKGLINKELPVLSETSSTDNTPDHQIFTPNSTYTNALTLKALREKEKSHVHFEDGINSSIASSRLSESDQDLPKLLSSHGHGPRKYTPAVALDAGIFGDYDLAKSPSTQDLVLHYLDKTELAKRRNKSRKNLLFLPHAKDGKLSGPVFASVFKHYNEGVTTILDDNFWKCFKRRKIPSWNFNVYLFPVWLLGVFFRYLVLFPIRFLVFMICFGSYFLGMLVVHNFFTNKITQKKLEIKLIQFMCGVFFFSWGAVVQYHGQPFRPRLSNKKSGKMPAQILPRGDDTGKNNRIITPVYVSNHTTMTDVIILLQVQAFSLVGQKHKGFAGFLQDKAIKCLQCVWFNRGELKDRTIVAQKLFDHSTNKDLQFMDPDNPNELEVNNPLLVFPEGTCVNNEYCIQFKKGVFELDMHDENSASDADEKIKTRSQSQTQSDKKARVGFQGGMKSIKSETGLSKLASSLANKSRKSYTDLKQVAASSSVKSEDRLRIPVCPVAIKYSKVFNDPFWSSKDQSFPMYLLELMTSWCLICDVYFLEPMYRENDEDGVQFAARVKEKISKKGGLKSVEFDGYMKHWKPSQRYVKARQSRFATGLRRILKEAEVAKYVQGDVSENSLKNRTHLMQEPEGGDDDMFTIGQE